MKRKEFIKKSAALAAGTLVVPYILPSGRLFARTNAPLADHVVLCLFAGGMRQQEGILQRYIDDSQGAGIAGNIMYNLFEGAAPDSKIVYGTTPAGEPDGSKPIPKILSETIEKQGTIFREMTAISGGHYGGLTSAITGATVTAQGLKVRPTNPTVFEYIRKHLGYKATDAWFIGSGIGNSTPLLNSSLHPDYGLEYGGNFFAPGVTFGSEGRDVLRNAKVYHPQEEQAPMYKMKNFLDNTFRIKKGDIPGIKNTDEEKNNIKEFIRSTFINQQNGNIALPPVGSGDGTTIGYAIEVLKWFKPKLLVLNMGNIDGCHSNFTGYLKAMHRGDHAVGHLWNQIQTQIPEMADKTIMMVTPECGRNQNPNPIQDQNNWYAYDHSGDANTHRIFGAMVGPNVPKNLSVGSVGNKKGYVTDMALTIAEILGCKDEVAAAGIVHSSSRSLFDRI
jgi:hypothetical protein